MMDRKSSAGNQKALFLISPKTAQESQEETDKAVQGKNEKRKKILKI